ncbi:hypothetical protein [Jiella marina]|uniref:hypothetical protein n=1 Tax=Jiella sp. LLJ827 TaxID=2917712 RepID=UPI002101703A|nr:hypothetical protein [Jiella sp. LLJ827]MCQ0990555.1 hypothetical protein [Jiella sp. LLJ827]
MTSGVRIKGIKELSLFRKKVKISAETKKKNPNSLRFIIAHLIKFYFDSRIDIASKEISKFGGIYVSNKSGHPPKKMNVKALSEITSDEDYIYYWHLESISKSVGIPAGALLLLSKVYSLERDGNHESAKEFAKSIGEFSKILEEMLKDGNINKEYTDNMARCFIDSFKLEEPNIFSIISNNKADI